MHRKAFQAAFALLLLLLPSLCFAVSPEVDRLAEVGKLWGTVRYLHPYLAYKDIDWDAALVAAIPRVREAKTPEEYRAAVQGMLGVLGDPVTRMMEPPPSDPPPPALKPAEEPKFFRKHDGVLVIDLARYIGATSPRQAFMALRELNPELEKSGTVILDLRGGKPGIAAYYVGVVLEQLTGALIGRPAQAPAQRYLLHSGYRPQNGGSSGGYFSGFITQAAEVFEPPPGGAASPKRPKRLIFLLDEASDVPPVALALQAVGDARLVSEGKLSEESVVATRIVDLGEGVKARVRVSEIVPFPGWRGVRADVEVPPDKAFEAALGEARKEWASLEANPSVQALPDAVYRADKTYEDMLEPALEHRQLAVVRAWNVIHWFYPYLHLIGDWDAVLPEFLARMDEAKTGRDYALTVAEMMTRVPDGHTFVAGHPELDKLHGDAWVPIQVRWIEGAAVAVLVSDEVRQKGIEVGDAILAVDGEPVEARIDWLSRTVTASTRTALVSRICAGLLLRGPAGPVALKIQKLDGSTREVSLVRDPKPPLPPEDKQEVVRILPGNLGYVDLVRLSPAEVDGMFETLKGTRGLIFDMRGYPQGTAWAIAPRINTRNAKIGAQFRRSLVTATSGEESESGFYFAQPLPNLPEGVAKYTAPTVMIIDDRAISQSEHTGLFFEAASGTKFVGTPTAGANGDVTRFTLPGGIMVGFTGHDVRHADGRQLQRVGLIPDVEAAPTRAGLKAGRDEVLEKAMEVLETEVGKAGATP